MKIKFILLVSLILTLNFLSFSSTNLASASSGVPTVDYETVNPKDGLSYGTKRLKEKIIMAVYTLFPNKKADYYLKLSNSRLAELKYIVDNNDGENFEVATKRYFTTIGQYSEYLNSKNLNDKMLAAKENLKNHGPVLEVLRDTFDPTTAQWRFVQDDINYLKNYSDSLQP